jgi:protein-disulfide isomerase
MSVRREAFLNAAAVFVALCTVLLVGFTVFDRFVAQPAPSSRPQRSQVRLDNWLPVAAEGHRLGPENADVTVVVFSDFECPICRTFALETFPELEARYPGRVALVFRHWPLTGHRFAYPAARASECAAQQGRFFPFHDLLFSQQREFGLKPFSDFASEAGVQDLPAFDKCYANTEPVESIENDIREAMRVGGIGTPTVMVNEWVLIGGTPPQLLDSIARQVLENGDQTDRTIP